MVADSTFQMVFHDSEDPGPHDPTHPMHRAYASGRAIWLLAAYGLGMFVLVMWIILTDLPDVLAAQNILVETEASSTGDAAPGAAAAWETALVELVLCFGAIGGLLHLFTSLGRFVGARQLQRSWLLFYVLRPPIGAALGLFVYFALRMGVLSDGSASSLETVNVYGVLAFAGLAGMFSRQAIEKLAEMFDVFFRKTKDDVERREATQLFRDAARDDVSVPLAPGPPPLESFQDEESVRE